ncbi:glutathione transferase GstA [Viridibacterium curvum]|uniref:Glutathione transferase GstA n=1 Tax=Viridibacterium curvum TaxID=1101404 RepID=A0ABP9Q9J9_9RHOO
MKLYFAPGVCSLSPHIALREAGLPFELQRVDTKTKEMHGGGNFLEVNPKGYVPVLQLDNGELLTEGPAIVQYIADLKPEAKIAPANGTLERYRLQEWLNYITAELHKGFSPLFKPNTPDEYKTIARENLVNRISYVAEKLQGKTWLLGDQFSVADGYLFVVLGWGKFVGVDVAQWPVIVDYLARVAARPAVQEALKAEGLLK